MGAEPQVDDRFLTDQEAADYTGQSARTIRRWRESGIVPYYRLGRPRIRKSDLDAYLEQHRVDVSQETPGNLRSMLQKISNNVLKKSKRPEVATDAKSQKERTKEKELKEIHEREKGAGASEEHIREGNLVFTVTQHKKLQDQWGDRFPQVMAGLNRYHEQKPIIHPYKMARAWKLAPEQPEPAPRPEGGANHETRRNRSQDTRQDENMAAAERLRARRAFRDCGGS